MSAFTFLTLRTTRPVQKWTSAPLQNLAKSLTRRLHPLKGIDAKDAAIAILQAPFSTPDQCEWAERFLCGMTGSDTSTFMEDRRSQS